MDYCDKLLKENGNIITFSPTGEVFDSNESGIQLGKFEVFDKGLIIVASIEDSKSSAWVFLRPFTVIGSFMVIGIVIWILQHFYLTILVCFSLLGLAFQLFLRQIASSFRFRTSYMGLAFQLFSRQIVSSFLFRTP